jgi:hypothetical protein
MRDSFGGSMGYLILLYLKLKGYLRNLMMGKYGGAREKEFLTFCLGFWGGGNKGFFGVFLSYILFIR